MRVDDPSDGDAADDRIPEHDYIGSATAVSEDEAGVLMERFKQRWEGAS